MAITPEKKVKNAVVLILKEYDAYWFYASTHGYGQSGVPDIVACYRGYFIAIECKAGSNVPSALQTLNLSRITKSGGIALVVNERNIDDVRQAIRSIDAITGTQAS
jgi:hypothetical protein